MIITTLIIVLYISCFIHVILVFARFWKGMYHRYDVGLHPREQIADILSAAKDHTDSLEDHVTLLEKVTS
jgi:hypothetical protein